MSELLLLLPKFNSLDIISKKFLWLYRNFPLLEKAVIEEWDKRQREVHKDDINIESKISQLKTQALLTVEKIKMLTSEVAIKYMEEELVKIELQIAELQVEKEKMVQSSPTDMRIIMAYVKYFLEHMENLLLEGPNPIQKASYFGVLFDKAPTYEEINGTPNLAQCIALNEVFTRSSGNWAAGHGFEP